MEEVLKGVGAAAGGATKQIPEIQQALPLPELEPEPNGYGKDVGIVIVGIVLAASLYKLWLKYGKK